MRPGWLAVVAVSLYQLLSSSYQTYTSDLRFVAYLKLYSCAHRQDIRKAGVPFKLFLLNRAHWLWVFSLQLKISAAVRDFIFPVGIDRQHTPTIFCSLFTTAAYVSD